MHLYILQLGKTDCILFGPKRKLNDFMDISIVCNNHFIKFADHVKYLGVIIDNGLSGEYIVESIVQKVNSRKNFYIGKPDFFI